MKKTDEALAELIKKGIETAEKTGRFVIDNAPELIKEFYTWHIVQNIFGIVLGVLILFAVYKLAYKSAEDEKSWDADIKIFGKWITFPCALFGGISSIVGFTFLSTSIYDLLFILTSPKLYLIEYFLK